MSSRRDSDLPQCEKLLEARVDEIHEQRTRLFVQVGLGTFTTSSFLFLGLKLLENLSRVKALGEASGQELPCRKDDEAAAIYQWIASTVIALVTLLLFDRLHQRWIVAMFFLQAAVELVSVALVFEYRASVLKFYYFESSFMSLFWLVFACMSMRVRQFILLLTFMSVYYTCLRLALAGPGPLSLVSEPGCDARAMPLSEFNQLDFPSLASNVSTENLGRSVVMMLAFGLVLCMSRFHLEWLGRDVIRQSLELEVARNTKGAVVEMLGKLCDCVVYLDSELHVSGSAPKLASLLHTAKQLEGTSILQVIQEQDCERFATTLRSGSSSHQFVAIKDAYNVNVQVQVFHTTFQDLNGHQSYILGIDEVGERDKLPVCETIGPLGGSHSRAVKQQAHAGAGAGGGGGGGDNNSCSDTSGSSGTGEGETVSVNLRADFLPSLVVKECTIGFAHFAGIDMRDQSLATLFEEPDTFRTFIVDRLTDISSGQIALPHIAAFGPAKMLLQGGRSGHRIYMVRLEILFPDPARIFAGCDDWSFDDYTMGAKVTWRQRKGRPRTSPAPLAASSAAGLQITL